MMPSTIAYGTPRIASPIVASAAGGQRRDRLARAGSRRDAGDREQEMLERPPRTAGPPGR